MLKEKAEEIAEAIEKVPGVVDVDDGLVVAGPSLRINALSDGRAAHGLTPARRFGDTVQTACWATVSSLYAEGDRTLGIRVMVAPQAARARTADRPPIPLRAVTSDWPF